MLVDRYPAMNLFALAPDLAIGFDPVLRELDRLLEDSCFRYPLLVVGANCSAELLAGYTIVVETVFAWPGIGQLGIGAMANHDLPLIQAVVLFGASVVVGANLIVDIAYAYLDPRLRHAG